MLYTTLRQLEYVVAVADAGRLTEAARLLNISQPALSVAISQVEHRQGRALFTRRKGAPLVPTTFGQTFIHDARALLEEAARLEDPKVQSQRRLTQIVLGIYDDLAPSYFAPALRHLGQHFPHVRIIPQIGNFDTLATGILDGSIHLAITYDLGLDASFTKNLIASIAPHAFTTPDDPLAQKTKASLAEIAHKPLILFEQGLSIRHMLGLFHAQGLAPRIAHRATSLEVMRSLAANGEGIGISYTKPAGNVSYDGRPLCAIPISDSNAREPVILAYVAQNLTMAPLESIAKSILTMGTPTPVR